jgi:hypothetical protein
MTTERMTSQPASRFRVEKGEICGRTGWLVLHGEYTVVNGGYPFKTRRLADAFVSRLPGLLTAEGARFDWDAAGVFERLADGYGPDGQACRRRYASCSTRSSSRRSTHANRSHRVPSRNSDRSRSCATTCGGSRLSSLARLTAERGS